jgi:Tfp pilus assembly protein PilO
MTTGLTLEIMLIALLVITIGYCISLDRKITKLIAQDAAREVVMAELSEKMNDAKDLKNDLQNLRSIPSPSINNLTLRAQQFYDKRRAA